MQIGVFCKRFIERSGWKAGPAAVSDFQAPPGQPLVGGGPSLALGFDDQAFQARRHAQRHLGAHLAVRPPLGFQREPMRSLSKASGAA